MNDGQLTIKEEGATGKNNAISIAISGQDLLVSDAIEVFVSVPAGATLSGDGKSFTIPRSNVSRIVVLGDRGDDSLKRDLSDGDITYSNTEPKTLNQAVDQAMYYWRSTGIETKRGLESQAALRDYSPQQTKKPRREIA